jgi:hypothetical protein
MVEDLVAQSGTTCFPDMIRRAACFSDSNLQGRIIGWALILGALTIMLTAGYIVVQGWRNGGDIGPVIRGQVVRVAGLTGVTLLLLSFALSQVFAGKPG